MLIIAHKETLPRGISTHRTVVYWAISNLLMYCSWFSRFTGFGELFYVQEKIFR